MKQLLIVVAAVITTSACATSSTPRWARETPQGYRFDYVVGYGEAETLRAAQIAAEADARRQVGLVNSTMTVTSDVSVSVAESSAGIDRSGSVTTEVRSEGLPTMILGWERVSIQEDTDPVSGGVSVWGLYRRAKGSGARRAPGRANFVLKNVFMPGWGQRAMERDVQANAYTLSYIAAWGAFAASSYMRNQEITKLNAARDAMEQSRALNAVNQWGDVRNISLGAAIGVWSISLIDALSQEPKFLPMAVHNPTLGSTELRWSIPR